MHLPGLEPQTFRIVVRSSTDYTKRDIGNSSSYRIYF